jgi:predicted phosphodiesterase
MVIGILTDSHFSFDKRFSYPNLLCLNALKEHNPDVIVHCGDTCLTNYLESYGYWQLVREVFPKISIATTLGNHDLWDKLYDLDITPQELQSNYKRPHNFEEAIDNQFKVFSEFNIKYISDNNIIINNINFIGLDGWYSDYDVPMYYTNDGIQIPNFKYNHSQLQLRSRSDIQFKRALDSIDINKINIMVTHFGFTQEEALKDHKNYKNDLYFGNNPEYENHLENIDYLICGHTHVEYIGVSINNKTKVINVGGSYNNPQFGILTL